MWLVSEAWGLGFGRGGGSQGGGSGGGGGGVTFELILTEVLWVDCGESFFALGCMAEL